MSALCNSPVICRRPDVRPIGAGMICCLCLCLVVSAAAAAQPKATFFPLTDVRLLDGPFKRSQEVNGQYIVQHDMDRLLAPFRTEAGLPPKQPPYGGWEETGMGGHAAGHQLSALAQMYASTGDEEYKQRLDYMVGELAECQKAQGDGYVGGVPDGRTLWREISEKQIFAGPFHINTKWVPWYNLHKTFAGLRDAWLVAGNDEARDVLVSLADWCHRLVESLSDTELQSMLATEHGGMNEVLADVSAITGDDKYLALARRFSHRTLLEPLLSKEDRLTAMHVNTNIPKVVGFARVGELGDDPDWIEAAKFFWEEVITRRTAVVGGIGVGSIFNPPDEFSMLIEARDGLETCCTHNMLRLTEQLFRLQPEARYADYYERALFNHILSSQHPERGGLVYFTPMRPGSRRGYSAAGSSMTCCVGTGIQSHSKHGRFIYAASDGGGIYVNLFIPSELNWKERGVKLRQETEFPDVPRTRLVLSLESPVKFPLHVRYPGWVRMGELQISMNGEPVVFKATPASYVSIEREWRDGDRVEVEMPMHTRLERLPDGTNWAAVVQGPIVLAGTFATDPTAKPVQRGDVVRQVSGSPEDAPRLVGGDADILAGIESVADKPLTFKVGRAVQPETFRDIELIPFARLHDTRYMVYWKTEQPAQ
jgi:DUF1680 family protein